METRSENNLLWGAQALVAYSVCTDYCFDFLALEPAGAEAAGAAAADASPSSDLRFFSGCCDVEAAVVVAAVLCCALCFLA